MKLSFTRLLVGLVLALAAIRLLSLGLYPLGDTTEARYGEVARQMATGGNWVTPFNDPGVPFWAKPPLSFWAQAGSMVLLGVNEFAARISSFLFAVAMGALLVPLARGRTELWLALLLYAAMPLTFLMAGAVMTDMALAFSTTLSMTGFWMAWRHGSRAWGYAFFAGLGIALLAKGPIGVVLAIGSVGLFWLLEPRRWQTLATLLRCLPWIGGLALAAAIAVPWYWLAEQRTPGFLHYFLIGEHVLRFLQPGWKGDLYGNAHVEARGMIWVFYAWAVACWLQLLAWLGWDRWRRRATVPRSAWESLDRYLLAWVLGTPIFFSAAGNTIWTYLLPCLPALALLMARHCRPEAGVVRIGVPAIAAGFGVAYAVLFLFMLPSPRWSEMRSTRDLVALAERTATAPQVPLLVLGRPRHSTKFYSRATAQEVTLEQLAAALERPTEVLVIAPAETYDALPWLHSGTTLVRRHDDLVLLQHLPARPAR